MGYAYARRVSNPGRHEPEAKHQGMKQPKATLSQGHDITFDVPAVAIQGNLSDGFRIFGPFETMDDASDWSDNQPSPMLFGIGDWWIATLEPTE